MVRMLPLIMSAKTYQSAVPLALGIEQSHQWIHFISSKSGTPIWTIAPVDRFTTKRTRLLMRNNDSIMLCPNGDCANWHVIYLMIVRFPPPFRITKALFTKTFCHFCSLWLTWKIKSRRPVEIAIPTRASAVWQTGMKTTLATYFARNLLKERRWTKWPLNESMQTFAFVLSVAIAGQRMTDAIMSSADNDTNFVLSVAGQGES